MNYHCDETNSSVDEEITELAGGLRRLWHELFSDMHHHIGQLEGLQRQQFWVLGSLAHGPRKMSELAGCAQTSQASLTGIVDRLEERGLVERVRSSEDRRVVQVALTEQGRSVMRLSHARMIERIDLVLGRLDADERREFVRLIDKITTQQPKEDE